nr:AI-2E family transporter [Beijerinckia indica]
MERRDFRPAMIYEERDKSAGAVDADHSSPIGQAVGRGPQRMRIEWQIGFWIAAFLLLILFFWLFSAVILPFAAAVVLGYLLDPVADHLERLGLNRLGATLLILAAFVLLLVAVLILIVPVLGHQLAGFIQSLPEYIIKLQDLISKESDRLTDQYIGVLVGKLGLSRLSGPELAPPTSDMVSQVVQWGAGFIKSLWTGGAALVSLISLLVVTPVVAFYMLLDWDKMIAKIDSLIPIRHRATVRELASEIDGAMAGFLRGQSLVCLFLGLWYGIGFTLVGLNFGLLIGISAGILSFIPYVGSLTALVVGSTVAVVQDWPSWHLLAVTLGVIAVGQFLEGNILSPKLVGESVGLHPVWVMFSLLAFGSLFGFTGLLTAVPLAAAMGVVLRFAVKRYRDSPLYTGVTESAPKIFIDVNVLRDDNEQ